MLQIRFLGQFDIRADGKRLLISTRAAQSLFAFLVLTAGTPHRREKLAGLLWPDVTDENARRSLRQELWRLRKVLNSQPLPAASVRADEYLVSEELTIAFNAAVAHWFDVAQFEQPISGDETLNDLTHQLALYKGELLPGFYDDWVFLERERVEQVYERKMQQLLDLLVQQERWTAVLEWSERWIAGGHTPEPAYRALMLAHGALGNPSQVKLTYERGVQALQEELGVKPSEESRALYEQLFPKAQLPLRPVQPSAAGTLLDRRRAFTDNEAPAPGEPPFKGLDFFDESDAGLFFGREALTAKLARTLREKRFLAVVVGSSGSGKSSIVRAGLIPALRREDGGGELNAGAHFDAVYVMTPTAHPLEALADVLTHDSASVTATGTLLDNLAREPRAMNLFLRRRFQDQAPTPRARHRSFLPRQVLLVVDQFEELFTLCRDEFEREQFIDNLLEALRVSAGESAMRGRVLTLVLTLRADFYSQLAQYPGLRELVAQHQEYIGSMNIEELRRAIQEPARRGGWEFEPGLVDLILRDVGEEPGALPLLSHALLETWKRRVGHRMTLKGYAEAGGVQSAIAHTAESVYETFSPAAQQIARDIFVRLTELGDGTEDTRRRATFTELLSDSERAAETRTVLNTLANARLLTLSETAAEVAHEALIREWPRLREWLNQDREGLQLYRRLTEAAQEWELLEHDPGALFRGVRLAQAIEFVALNSNALNAHERAFLKASEELEKREIREREEQHQRELQAIRKLATEQQAHAEESYRANQRLRQRAAFLAGALVLAILFAGLAWFLGDQSRRNATAAAQNAAQAEMNANAEETARLNAERERRASLGRELAASAISNLESDPERSILLALAAVKASEQDQTVLPEAQSALHQAVLASRVNRTLTGHTNRVWHLAYSPDGSHLATIGDDGTVRVWETASGRQVYSFPVDSRFLGNLTFSADGTRLAMIDRDQADLTVAKIWDAQAGKLLRTTTLPLPSDARRLDAWNSDLSRVVVGSSSGNAFVYDSAVGKLLLTLVAAATEVYSVAYSPDGSRIVTASNDGSAKVWDATTGQELIRLCCHSNWIPAITFSPDGKRVATGSLDRTAKVWDTATGKELFTLADHVDGVFGVAFSQDGKFIGTASFDQKAKVWDAQSGKERVTLTGHTGFDTAIAFSPDGSHLATASFDQTAKIWDLLPPREALVLPSNGGLSPFYGTVAYSSEGTRLAAGLKDGGVQIWDATSGKEFLTLRGHTDTTHRVAFSRDGTRLVSGSSDKTAKLWDAVTGKELHTFRGHADEVLAVAISPDGTRVATGSGDQTVKVWDTRSGAELVTFPTNAAVMSLAFSPNGSRLAAGTTESDLPEHTGTVYLWDLTMDKAVFAPVENVAATWIAFSPDGTRLAIAQHDVIPKVLDAATGSQLLSLRGLTSIPLAIDYSPDGKQLATANFDGSAIVWDATNGNELFTVNDKSQNGLQSVAFSPDGARLALADVDTVRVYLLQIQDLVELAKSRLTRTWRQDECQKYLHLEKCPATE